MIFAVLGFTWCLKDKESNEEENENRYASQYTQKQYSQ